MHTVTAFLLATALVGTLAAQTNPSAKTPPPKKAPSAETKSEEPPQIEGVAIARGDRGFLGVQIVEAKFRLNFYDADKEPVAPDVSRAALRWNPSYKLGEERVVLTPGGVAHALSSERIIRPPYHFKLFIVLVKDAADGQEPINETHVVDFRQ